MHVHFKGFDRYDQIALQNDPVILYDLQQHGPDPRCAVSLKMK